jgi:hypothetical protein
MVRNRVASVARRRASPSATSRRRSWRRTSTSRTGSVLRRELEPQVERNYDVIALCERRGWQTLLRLDFAVSADGYSSVVGELFGSVATVG